MELYTERCIIRNFTEEDAEDLYEVLSDEKVMTYIEPVFDMEKTKKFIQNKGLSESPMIYAVVLRETLKVIGQLIFHYYEKDDYEIGWIIRRDYWGIGIADELTKAILKYAKGLDLKSIVIECDENQSVSKHIAEKNGFIYETRNDNLEIYRYKIY